VNYTVILRDYSEHRWGSTRVVVESGETAYDAAQYAEITIATETFGKLWPGVDPIDGNHDDDWMSCMDSVGVVAVIEGTPKTYYEDAITENDLSEWIVNA